MICDECKYCDNFHVCEVGCFGSDKPCEYFHSDDYINRPKGKWEFVQYDGNPNIGNWHCTNCRGIAKPHTNYFPNCGARMESDV